MIIQALLVSAVIGFTVVVFRGSTSARQLALRRLTSACLAALGLVAVLMPQWVTWIANRVGVGRGTDLVLYLLVLAFLWMAVATHRRISDLETRYAELSRRLSIEDAFQRDATELYTSAVKDSQIRGEQVAPQRRLR